MFHNVRVKVGGSVTDLYVDHEDDAFSIYSWLCRRASRKQIAKCKVSIQMTNSNERTVRNTARATQIIQKWFDSVKRVNSPVR